MINFSNQPLFIGIDISDYSIKLLKLNGKKEVLFFKNIELEEGIVENGIIINKKEVIDRLKKALEEIEKESISKENILSRKRTKTVLSLPESRTFIHYFELSENLSNGETEKKIIEEGLKIIPFDSQKIYSDYRIVKNGFKSEKGLKNKEKKQKRILYVASTKELVNDYVEVIMKAGISPAVLDIESASIGRILFPLYLSEKERKQGSDLMILDMGARTINLSIFNEKGDLNLSITIPFGGNKFTEEIAKTLKKEKKEAEIIKRNFGLDKTKENNKIIPVLEPIFQNIVKEIKKAISYYEKKGGKIERIVLVGGSALLPKVDEYLEGNLKKKVILANPLKNIKDKIKIKNINPVLLANVVGLALRGTENIEEGINLLPKIKKTEKKIWLGLINLDFLKKEKVKTIYKFAFIIFAFLFLLFVAYNYILKTGSAVDNNEKTREINSDIIEKQESILVQEVLRVREGPGTEYDTIRNIYPGEEYLIFGEKGNWYKIKIDEENFGWVISDYVTKK